MAVFCSPSESMCASDLVPIIPSLRGTGGGYAPVWFHCAIPSPVLLPASIRTSYASHGSGRVLSITWKRSMDQDRLQPPRHVAVQRLSSLCVACACVVHLRISGQWRPNTSHRHRQDTDKTVIAGGFCFCYIRPPPALPSMHLHPATLAIRTRPQVLRPQCFNRRI